MNFSIEVGTSEVNVLTFGLSPLIKLGICYPRKKERKKDSPASVTTHLGQTLTLSPYFSQLRLTNLFCTLLGATKITQCQTPAPLLCKIPNFSQSNLKILRTVDKPNFCDARLRRVAGSGYTTVGQWSQDLSTNFLITHVLDSCVITHVLDSCVKLLAGLHISSVQGRSVDLPVEIATGWLGRRI